MVFFFWFLFWLLSLCHLPIKVFLMFFLFGVWFFGFYENENRDRDSNIGWGKVTKDALAAMGIIVEFTLWFSTCLVFRTNGNFLGCRIHTFFPVTKISLLSSSRISCPLYIYQHFFGGFYCLPRVNFIYLFIIFSVQ